MLKKVALVVLAIIAVLLVVIVTRPDTYRVQRSTAVAAPPAVVFGLVNDFHQWAPWSPWGKLDPNMKLTYDGPAAGVGASYFWTGNDKVGEGRMTITESVPSERIVIKLEFLKPWEATSVTTFTFAPQGDSTQVTWVMDGTNNFVTKAFSLFMNMDSMIGKDFELGLAQLKSTAETAVRERAAAAAAAPPSLPPAAPPAAAPAVPPVAPTLAPPVVPPTALKPDAPATNPPAPAP